MSEEDIEIADLSSVRALLKDARNRIKEAEDRCKETISKLEGQVVSRCDELSVQLHAINLEQNKWIPLLTNLQKADENKRNLTLLLLVSFITNIATIIMTVFIWFVKAGIVTK
jgi:hypothetical protein